MVSRSLVKDGYNYVKIFIKEINYLNSDRNYVVFNLNTGKRIMVRSTLAQIQERLDPDRFIKINRSCIVNIHCITKIETDSIHIGGEAFAVTKTQRDDLVRRMSGSR